MSYLTLRIHLFFLYLTFIAYEEKEENDFDADNDNGMLSDEIKDEDIAEDKERELEDEYSLDGKTQRLVLKRLDKFVVSVL